MFLIKSLHHLRANSLNCIKTIEYKTNLISNTKTGLAFNLRLMSTNSDHKTPFNYELPPLMKFTPKGVPNLLYSLKNKFIVNYYLKPMIDKDFDSKKFLIGAKQALITISSHLANDDIEGIKQLVTEEAYEEVMKNYTNYSLEQKKQLEVIAEDVLFSFLYNIQINRQSPDSAVVKIFVVFDYLPEFGQILTKEKFNKNFKIFDFNKYLQNKILCNYEFIREYVKGVQTDWIVSKLMHIKDRDIIKMYGFYK